MHRLAVIIQISQNGPKQIALVLCSYLFTQKLEINEHKLMKEKRKITHYCYYSLVKSFQQDIASYSTRRCNNEAAAFMLSSSDSLEQRTWCSLQPTCREKQKSILRETHTLTNASATYQTGRVELLAASFTCQPRQLEGCSMYNRETDHAIFNSFKLLVYVAFPKSQTFYDAAIL